MMIAFMYIAFCVVLVNFWTFSCINSIRTFPLHPSMGREIQGSRAVVIGVQAPEFDFEKDLHRVQLARNDMRLDYPIAVDNDHVLWGAFNNEAWPAFYFVDAKGHIRHHQFGEGKYDQAEQIIQQLLTEAGNTNVPQGLVSVDARGTGAAPDWADMKSPETDVGCERTENFASARGCVRIRVVSMLHPHN